MGIKTSVVLNLNPAQTLSWRNDNVGDTWRNHDVVHAQHNQIVMISLIPQQSLEIILPLITPESVGKKISVLNRVSKFDGTGDVTLTVQEDNFIEGISSLEFSIMPNNGPGHVHFVLQSNGIDNWSFIYPDSGLSQLVRTPVNNA